MLHALDHVRRAFASSFRGEHLAGDKRDTCAPFFAEFTKISPCHILLLPDMRRCRTKNCKAQHGTNRSRLETPKSNSHRRAKLDNRFCSSRESSASRSLRRWTHATRNSRKTSGKNRADSGPHAHSMYGQRFISTTQLLRSCWPIRHFTYPGALPFRSCLRRSTYSPWHKNCKLGVQSMNNSRFFKPQPLSCPPPESKEHPKSELCTAKAEQTCSEPEIKPTP